MADLTPQADHDMAGELLAEAKGIRADNERIAVLENGNRRLIRILAFSVVADICLSLGLGVGFWRQEQFQGRLQTKDESSVKACEAANDARSKDRKLWEFVLSVPPDPTRTTTPEQKRRAEEIVAQFRRLVEEKDALRDCSKAADKNPVVTLPTTTRAP